VAQSPETYAKKIVPILFAPELEGRTGNPVRQHKPPGNLAAQVANRSCRRKTSTTPTSIASYRPPMAFSDAPSADRHEGGPIEDHPEEPMPR